MIHYYLPLQLLQKRQICLIVINAELLRQMKLAQKISIKQNIKNLNDVFLNVVLPNSCSTTCYCLIFFNEKKICLVIHHHRKTMLFPYIILSQSPLLYMFYFFVVLLDPRKLTQEEGPNNYGVKSGNERSSIFLCVCCLLLQSSTKQCDQNLQAKMCKNLS